MTNKREALCCTLTINTMINFITIYMALLAVGSLLAFVIWESGDLFNILIKIGYAVITFFSAYIVLSGFDVFTLDRSFINPERISWYVLFGYGAMGLIWKKSNYLNLSIKLYHIVMAIMAALHLFAL